MCVRVGGEETSVATLTLPRLAARLACNTAPPASNTTTTTHARSSQSLPPSSCSCCPVPTHPCIPHPSTSTTTSSTKQYPSSPHYIPSKTTMPIPGMSPSSRGPIPHISLSHLKHQTPLSSLAPTSDLIPSSPLSSFQLSNPCPISTKFPRSHISPFVTQPTILQRRPARYNPGSFHPCFQALPAIERNQ